MDQSPVDAKYFKEMWDRLPTPAKHGVLRRHNRKLERTQSRAQLASAPTPAFICPKCHKPHATAEARNACKAAHRQGSEAERERRVAELQRELAHNVNAVIEGGDAP